MINIDNLMIGNSWSILYSLVLKGGPGIMSPFKTDAEQFGGSDVVRCSISRELYEKLCDHVQGKISGTCINER